MTNHSALCAAFGSKVGKQYPTDCFGGLWTFLAVFFESNSASESAARRGGVLFCRLKSARASSADDHIGRAKPAEFAKDDGFRWNSSELEVKQNDVEL